MEYEEIGKCLRDLRKLESLKLKDLSVKTFYSPQHISNIERLNSKVSLFSLCQLLDAMGYELEFVPKKENTVVRTNNANSGNVREFYSENFKGNINPQITEFLTPERKANKDGLKRKKTC